MSFILKQTKDFKIFKSDSYSYIFNKNNGTLIRWGKTKDDDPDWSFAGPEIFDIEISSGFCHKSCPWCYKENGKDKIVKNMTLEQFKIILSKIPVTLTQIAFGITGLETNSEMWKIFEYTRSQGIIPNFTCNGLGVDNQIAKNTADLCGAVAISVTENNKQISLEAIHRFIDNGCKQVNIHYMLSKQTYEWAFEIVDSVKNIKGFQAIVFLQYKPKGRNKDKYDSLLDPIQYRKLVAYCDANGVSYGFDSCSCGVFLESIKDRQDFSQIKLMSEPCESGLFSGYANCDGIFFPCSFLEGEGEWKEGLDIMKCNDFITDIWMNPKTIKWRETLINNKRNCPYYFQDSNLEKK